MTEPATDTMPTEAIASINRLLQSAIDGREDFAQAAELVADEDLKQVLAERAADYAQLVDELQREVRDLGGTPSQQGSVAAAAHRGWVRVVAGVGDAEIATLDELQRGEEDKRRAFDAGLQAPRLPPAAREAIERRRQRLFGGAESVPRLRRRFHHGR